MILALLLVNLGIGLVALLRLRPATFIFAASHIEVLRALLRVKENGQPDTQSFVPSYVFGSGRIDTAASLFAISTAALLVALLLVPKSRATGDPKLLPTLPRPAQALVAAFLLFEVLIGGNIASTSYGDLTTPVNFGGLYPFIHTAVLYELYRRVAIGRLTPTRAFAYMFALVFALHYAKGGTGMATGLLITAACVLFSLEPEGMWRRVKVFGAIGGVVLLSLGVRAVRGSLSWRGSAAIGDYADAISSGDASKNDNAEQSVSHVLECISLYENGVSREWRSVYSPLIYTFEPAFLLKPLGIERPREAAWELGDYYVHGGGIHVIGEFYWNGGYVCVLLMTLLMAILAAYLDTRMSRGFVWVMLLCQTAPNLLMGFQYGFAQVSRGLVNGLLACAIYKALAVGVRATNSRLGSIPRSRTSVPEGT